MTITRMNHLALSLVSLFLFTVLMGTAVAQEKTKTVTEKKNLKDLKPEDAIKAKMQLGKVPLGFVCNYGQNLKAVKFEARGAGGSVALLKEGVALTLPVANETSSDTTASSVSLGIKFLGSNKDVHLKASKKLRGTNSFFFGQDKSKWHVGESTFADVTYQGLYSGIDLLYNGTTGRLKGTYTVAPGANPADIRWNYLGSSKVALEKKTGDLVIDVPNSRAGVGGKIREEAPIAWQIIDGKKKSITVSFVLNEKNEASFKVGSYDNKIELIIDPMVIFSTLMGGNGTDHAIHLKMDDLGHVYVVGRTHSNPGIMGFGPGWPVTANSFDDTYNGEIADAFIMKLDKTGTFQHWSAYLGGGDPVDFLITGGADWGYDVEIDSSGDIHICGFTESANFPITANAVQTVKSPSSADAFYTIISADGSQILYSTFIGGSDFDHAYSLALRGNGWTYLCGYTRSPDFPVTANCYQPVYGGFEDAFFVAINPGQTTPIYSTYFGDNTANIAYSIDVGPFGLAFFGGETFSTVDIATIPHLSSINVAQHLNRGQQDGFMCVMDPGSNGVNDLLYVTYLGGAGNDYIYALDVNKVTGETYMTGLTASLDFPLLNSQFVSTGTTDSFLTKIFPQGLGLFDFQYSIVLGTNQFDGGLDIDLRFSTVFYCGLTEAIPGNFDAYWIRFHPSGVLEDGALFGSSFFDMALSIDVNDTGVATCGYTQCINANVNNNNCFAPIPFPLVNPFIGTYNGGSGDGWVRKRTLN